MLLEFSSGFSQSPHYDRSPSAGCKENESEMTAWWNSVDVLHFYCYFDILDNSSL